MPPGIAACVARVIWFQSVTGSAWAFPGKLRKFKAARPAQRAKRIFRPARFIVFLVFIVFGQKGFVARYKEHGFEGAIFQKDLRVVCGPWSVVFPFALIRVFRGLISSSQEFFKKQAVLIRVPG